MSLDKNFRNALNYNNGIHITGPGPIDDRVVLHKVSDLYITVGSESSCVLYNRAYPGMMISVFEDDLSLSIYQLLDKTPYMKGGNITVDSTNLKLYWTIINDKTIGTKIEDATYFTSTADGSLKMITDHGNLPKNTTIAQLKQMTISNILQNILFETATPVKISDKSGSIHFNSPYTSVVEVGTALPSSSSFGYSYASEKWNWTSKDKSVSGTAVSLSKFDSIKYYDNGTELTTTSSGTATEGSNGTYYGVITYSANADAVDSLGSTTKADGTKYAAGQSGTITTSTISFNAAWRVYSNASKASASDLKAYKTTDPGAFKGNDNQTSTGVFGTSGSTIYLQWPNGTTESDNFYVYIPNSRSISSCARIADMTDDYNVTLTYTSQGTVDIKNTIGNVTGTFKKYLIQKKGGISTVKIVLS